MSEESEMLIALGTYFTQARRPNRPTGGDHRSGLATALRLRMGLIEVA
jgi:hypothetical protein